jgi:dUTPase
LKEIEVLYLEKDGLTVPTQGYDEDFAYDVYAAEGRLIPPLTFRSVVVPTNLHTAFDPLAAGMKIALRSGVAFRTPLIVSNAPGIIEGTYRGNIGILLRNSFIDNSLVNYVYGLKGEKIPLSEVPNVVKKEARKFFDEETEILGYDKTEGELKKVLFKTAVPKGTMYIAKGDRPAQMYFSPKIKATFKAADSLPDSTRGENGKGSSGTK